MEDVVEKMIKELFIDDMKPSFPWPQHNEAFDVTLLTLTLQGLMFLGFYGGMGTKLVWHDLWCGDTSLETCFTLEDSTWPLEALP
jgi:hypothetical protein